MFYIVYVQKTIVNYWMYKFGNVHSSAIFFISKTTEIVEKVY